jgi:branched-chain amino acid transport system substrate-binding protein
MKRILLSLVLVVLVVGIALMGCAKQAPSPAPTPAPEPPKTLDIGIVTTITGMQAFLGTHFQNTLLLAIDDQNAAGGVTIAGQKYMLNGIVRDSKFDVVVSKNVTEELVFDKGVKVIAGPMVGDTVGAQVVTEKNKIIFMPAFPEVPGVCSPTKPYSFFPGGYSVRQLVTVSAYTHNFYPQAKTVFTLVADTPDSQGWLNGNKIVLPRYGMELLGYEKVPTTTKDFMPLISRVLSKNPDIIDLSSTGATMGAASPLLLKQIREAGFKGLISCPTMVPPDVMKEVVPKDYLYRIITTDIVVDSPIVSQGYKDMDKRYVKKFGIPTIDVCGSMYDGIMPFFEFLNTQNTMDTTAWMEGFAKYRWQSLYGGEGYWVGKPIYGIDRCLLWGFWGSEWTDGKPETKWAAPIPLDLFVEKQ